MGAIKGEKEYKKFLKGDKLTRMQAMRAHCFMCNGEGEGRADCMGTMCPVYQYFPYKGLKSAEEALSMSARNKEMP